MARITKTRQVTADVKPQKKQDVNVGLRNRIRVERRLRARIQPEQLQRLDRDEILRSVKNALKTNRQGLRDDIKRS